MKHITFPSIGQFRNIIRQVTDTAKYHTEALPTLSFRGTVKLHGTNHGICMTPEGTIYTQSREHITTFESDNAGSNAWTMSNIIRFDKVFARIQEHCFVGTEDTIQIFGEWCGGNIQKSVGLSFVPKTFIVFAMRISKDAESNLFLSDKEVLEMCGQDLDCVYNYLTYKIDIDFSKPEQTQAELINLTNAVELDCPIARSILGPDFDKPLVGEGVVWTTQYKDQTLRFKVKGEKHSSSKVTTLAAIDVEKVENIREFVSSVATESRLTQGLEHVESRDPKNIGIFLKWVMSDIYKEEMDVMLANGFTSKEVSGPLATAIRQWFLQTL